MDVLFKIFMLAALSCVFSRASTVKRELTNFHPASAFFHLADFGPVSKIFSHPSFAHLGLSAQQTLGFLDVLHRNGFLHPHALRLSDGRPLEGPRFPSAPFQWFSGPVLDPYVLFLLSNHPKYLPYGVGPQGIFGTTGTPRFRPPGFFNHSDKNS